jgi:hypothetical protein
MASKKTQELTKGFAKLPPQPKRSAVPDKDADRFVRAPATPATSASKKRSDAHTSRLNTYVAPEANKVLRRRCFEEERSQADAVTEALDLWPKLSTEQLQALRDRCTREGKTLAEAVAEALDRWLAKK